MDKIIKPAIVLLVISIVVSACLAALNSITLGPIEEQKIKIEQEAMKKVYADATAFSDNDALEGDSSFSGTSVIKVVPALKDNDLVGYVVTTSTSGYGGLVDILTGVTNEGIITGIEILSHNETPGLGANATNDNFKSQYNGKGGNLVVTKTGTSADNEINALTGATITTSAITNSVNEAVKWVEENGGAN